MPAPAPFAQNNMNSLANNVANANNALYPALYLYPLNDTWAPKHISLTNQHTKIGRQTSSKTAPGERNGFFDSKVLSRQHAEVWEDGGKIYIKDVKSSNGTFINGERLSSEGHESEPFELKSDDIVEFGIDIVGEDNKTIIHHKVAARVVCVFSEQDVQVAARAEQHQQQQHQQQQQFLQQQQQQQHPHQAGVSLGVGAGPSGMNGIPGGVVNGAPQNFPFAQRRPQVGPGLGSMGGMRPPGKTGLSFDVILSRLQGEVQKSRETGAELTSLTSAMNEIHDTLGGAVPANLPPFPAHLPPVRPPPETLPLPASSSASPEQPSSNPPATVSAAIVVDLQSQLRDTQSSLATHLDKVRALEGVMAEQEMMRREVSTLKEMMDERRREMEQQQQQQLREKAEKEAQEAHRRREEAEHGHKAGREVEMGEEMEEEDDDDDARSVSTIGPHELERVDEEDEEDLAEDERQTFPTLGAILPPRMRREEGDSHLQETERETHKQIPAEDVKKQSHEEEPDEDETPDSFLYGRARPRPRTPEPQGFVVPFVDGSYKRRSSHPSSSSSPTSSSHSPSSPVSSSSKSILTTSMSFPFPPSSSDKKRTEEVYAQVYKLTKQVSDVVAMTAALEAQHSSAQTTIQALESKVATLEGLLRSAEEALAVKSSAERSGLTTTIATATTTTAAPHEVTQEKAIETEPTELLPSSSSLPSSPKLQLQPDSETLFLEKMALWKKVVEGQWTHVQEEWTHERQRLDKAREEWEARAREVDVGLEKMTHLQTTLAGQQQIIQMQLAAGLAGPSSYLPNGFGHAGHLVNGDVQLQVKHNGGLVTPPSPRSQSSDSAGRSSRRKKKRSASVGSLGSGRGRPRRGSGGSTDADALSSSDQEDDRHLDPDVDAHSGLSSSFTEEDDILGGKKHVFGHALGATTAVGSLGAAAAAAAARSLATPEPSVYKMGSSVHSLDSASSSSPLAANLKDKDRDSHFTGVTTSPNNNNGSTISSADSDAMASLSLFFALTQRVLLILFWSILSFVLVLGSGSLSLWSGLLSFLVSSRRFSPSLPFSFSQSLSHWLSSLPPSLSLWLRRILPFDSMQAETETTTVDKNSLGATPTSGPNINVQAAVGVVLLSVAAAAVFWKIKPE